MAKKANEGTLIFRRVRGRLIAFRQKNPEFVSGAAAVAAGVGIAAATGLGAAFLVRKSKTISIAAGREFKLASALTKAIKNNPEQLTLGLEKQVAKDFAKKLALKRYGAQLMFKARNPLLFGGGVVADSLISSGVTKIRSKKGHQDLGDRALQDAAISTGVALGVGSLYYNRLGLKSFGQSLRFAYHRFKKLPRPSMLSIKPFQSKLF